MPAPRSYTDNALVLSFEVASGQAVTIGEGVVLASDSTCQDAAAASDLAIGSAAASATAGNQVDIYMYGWAVVPVLVGTGDATRGTKAQLVGDGFTDCTAHASNGAGNESQYGVFLQSGVATNWVGLMLTGCGNRGV